ncbi:MAG: hypothetical protein AAGF94_01815 [Pseudomonadota bacterium]
MSSKSNKKGRMPGPLTILVALLIFSGVFRAISGPVAAVAKETVANAGASESGLVSSSLADKDMDVWIAELRSRDEAISQAEADIARDREALALAKEVLAEQLAALQAAQETLRRDLHQAGETAVGDVSQLTDVYQRMKPKEAAAIFEKMDPDFAAGFLARMKPDAAAAIMAGLPPDTAYAFSAILAGRNAEVPSLQ